MPRRLLPAATLLLAAAGTLRAADKITYADNVLPLFKNACLNCHNPDKKKAGLDLSTYEATLAGSDNGKVVVSGNPSGSLLVKCVRQTEDPKMPPKGDKLSDAEIALLEKWVQGQLLETATGKAVAASNDVQVAVVSLTRPDGPPPMPGEDLPLEPVVRTPGTNALVALAASPWAPLVAVGGQKQVVLYDTGSLQPLGILPFPEGFPSVIRFSRNGQLLLTGGGLGGKSGKVVLWKVASGERAGEVGNEFDQVLGADLSPDQQHVALGGPTKLLKIYSTKTGKLEQSLKKHTDWVTAVTFSPDGKYLASADRSGGIVVWEGTTGKEFVTLPGHKLMVTALAFMPGVLASASEDGKITLWDIKEGKEIRSWNAHAGGVESVDFTPDGRLVSSGRDKLAKVWDQNGKALLTTEEFRDIALRAVLSNERVVAGDWTGQIKVFNFPDNKRLGELSANPPTIQENLATANARVAELTAKLAPLREAAEKAQAALKTAADEQAAKRTGELAALEAKLKQAQAEREALKTPAAGAPTVDPAEAAKRAAAAEQAVAELRKAPLPPLAKELEPALAAAQAAAKNAGTELDAARATAERWQRAQAYMGVHRSRQSLAEMLAQLEALKAAIKDAPAPVEQLTTELKEAEKKAAEAATKAKAGGEAQGQAQAELTAVQQEIARLEGAAQQAALRRTAAEAALAKASADAPAAATALEAKTKEVAALEAAAGQLAAGTPERGAADGRLNGPRAELKRLEAAGEVAQAALGAAKTAAEHGAAEVTAAEAALAAPRARLASAMTKVTAAGQAATADQAAAKGAEARVAELRQRLPIVTAEAQAAKGRAEQEAGTLAQRVEAARAEAERLRAEFETRWRAARPLASSH